MSSRRWVILAAAVVLGLVAGGLVFNYVQGVEDDVNADAELVSVYVVKAPIRKGAFGSDAFAGGLIAKDEIQQKFRPENAITDPDEIRDKVALSDLAVNQVVVVEQFVSQAEAQATFSGTLEDNHVAITISIDQVRGVAGLLVPGDFVNVILREGGRSARDDGELGGCVDQSGNPVPPIPLQVCPEGRVLYQKAQILAIGQQRVLTPGETTRDTNPDGTPVLQNAGLVTLAVPVEAAQWIASAPPEEIYLTLVAPDYVPEDVAPIAPSPTTPGENPDQKTPYGPEGRQTP